jgi:hypothetical protein
MLYVLAGCILGGSIILSREKFQSYITLLFLWLLFAFSYGNADYNIHLRKYTQYQTLNSQTEWLYNKLMAIFNHLGLSYREFLIVLSVFVLLIIFNFVRKHTKSAAWVLAMYMIYPFCMDVTMVRYTLAISIVYIGLNFLFEGKKWWVVKYCVCVLIASMIHLSSIFCLLFMLPKFMDLKKLSKLMILLSIGITAFASFRTAFVDKLVGISFLNIGTKLSIVLNASDMKYNFRSVMNYREKMLLLLICALAIYYILYQWMKRNSVFQNDEAKVEVDFFKTALGMNVSILPLIGLLSFSADLFRIQLSLSIVNYVAFAQYFELRNKLQMPREITKVSKTTCAIVIGTVFVAIAGLYLWVLSSTNIVSVFRALFENNTLFS